jgi:hypothetical protein
LAFLRSSYPDSRQREVAARGIDAFARTTFG